MGGCAVKLGRIVGNVVATRKDDRLVGHKLLVLQILRPQAGGDLVAVEDKDGFLVAVDLVGAGIGETVLFCSGSSARASAAEGASPIDAAVVGIVDSLDVDLEAR